MAIEFFKHLQHYLVDILPSLALGFFLSGLIHEFIPHSLVDKYLIKKGILPIFYVTIIGIILPVCCLGSLPIAISFRKKGVALGPILAFLVATPATSITAILVTLKLFGILYTIYLNIVVILIGLIIGMIGNFLTFPDIKDKISECPMCSEGMHKNHFHHSKKISKRIVSVFSYGFIDLPKEIGKELVIGIILAAVVASITPIGQIIKKYLTGLYGYGFAILFGLAMYICSTASVPLVHAFVAKGLSSGAGLVMLIAGPVTSYGTILVIRKEFGTKILLVYLITIAILSLIFGYLFSVIKTM